jgi:uncharacterized damage-inducible protein DinB
MNANAFRHFFNYHFAINRFIWDEYIVPLSAEKFIQGSGYSHGSVRAQVVHLMTVDEAWFSGLRDVNFPGEFPSVDIDDRPAIRARWDIVEQEMRGYLAGLRDDMLDKKPFPEGEDENLILWQVLLHVVNHGTDHRAQLLRLLNDLGVQTTSQDYIFYVYEQPAGS